MTTTLILTIFGLALLDSVNPSLFITQFYLLTTDRPLPRILSYIAGVVVTNITVGFIVLAGLETVLVHIMTAVSPRVWRGLEFIAGVGLIGAGLWMRQRTTSEPTAKKPHSLRPVHTFLLGVVITLQEVSTAAPYLVAIERIAQAQMNIVGNLITLALYNAVYVAPLLIVVSGFLAGGTQMLKRLEGINRAINLWMPRLFRYICLVGGALLAIDATTFFVKQG